MGTLARLVRQTLIGAALCAPALADEPPGTLRYSENGSASFYRNSARHQRTASGEAFRQDAMTCAHAWLPFGTRLRVTLSDTGREVVVTVTDRLAAAHRVVDLSLAAARELGMLRRGVAEVWLTAE